MLNVDYVVSPIISKVKWVFLEGMFLVNPAYEGEFLSRHTDCHLHKVEVSA